MVSATDSVSMGHDGRHWRSQTQPGVWEGSLEQVTSELRPKVEDSQVGQGRAGQGKRHSKQNVVPANPVPNFL